MSGDDLTVSILREIRNEMRDGFRDVGSRLDATNDRLDATNDRLDATNESLNQRLEMTNQRLAIIETTVQDFAAQQLLLTRFVKNVSDRHDKAIENLDARVETLETKST